MKTEKKHFAYITLMNAFLCLAVVTIHLTAAPVSTLTVGTFWHFAMFAVNKMLSFAVPGFLFLSGYKLFLKYGGGKMHAGKFYLGRVKKVVLPYLAAVLLYVLYFLSKGWASVCQLPQYFLLGTIAAHFYYIIIAVQMYLLFPWLRRLFDRFPKTVTALSLFCTVVFQAFVSFPYSDRFIGSYIVYFVLGMAFAKYRTEKMHRLLLPASLAGALVLGTVHLILSYRQFCGEAYRAAPLVHLLWITFSIAAVYALCRALAGKYRALSASAGALGGVSYSVYLYHNLLLFVLQYDVFPHFLLSVRERFVIAFFVLFGAIASYAALCALWKHRRYRKGRDAA